MIEREALKGDAQSRALYSDCETYRYALRRVWAPDAPKLTYIMLNPSKATEAQNDPTIERCERRARALGFGGFAAVNLFALRETDPRKMRAHAAPEGPDNSAQILAAAHWADMVLCAWGVHGAHLARGPATESLLRSAGLPLHVLGLTKAGAPRHPLYMAYAAKPKLWIS